MHAQPCLFWTEEYFLEGDQPSLVCWGCPLIPPPSRACRCTERKHAAPSPSAAQQNLSRQASAYAHNPTPSPKTTNLIQRPISYQLPAKAIKVHYQIEGTDYKKVPGAIARQETWGRKRRHMQRGERLTLTTLMEERRSVCGKIKGNMATAMEHL